ncbi:hypothetical protein MUA23_09330 [Mammaliicoccus sciuri]|uniref:hypothetical protein n=1 Tax=Mammaliicoccus sciuri TaxID=1296 RepID=UPI0021CEC6E1|nr:hypothetical protein [Mammaliicoccus sciuri]UXU71029.1 hypothetical protein MUA23_09330 [Mammaliicoccus sciuri]
MFLILLLFLAFLVLSILNIRKRKKSNLNSQKETKKTRILLGITAILLLLYFVTMTDSDKSNENSTLSEKKNNNNKSNEKPTEKEKKKGSKEHTYTKKELSLMSHEELDNIPSDEYLNMNDDIREYYLDRLGQFAPKSDEEEESQDDTEDNTSPDEMTESEYKKNLNAYKTQMEIVGEDLKSLNDSLQSGIITSDTKESTYNAQAMYEAASRLIRKPLEEEEPPENYKEFNDRLVSMDDRYLEAFELLNKSAEANDEASLQIALDTLEVITEEYVVNVKHSLVD